MKRFVFSVSTVFLGLFFLMSLATTVSADTKKFQASLTPEVALYEKDVKIEGLSLNIWGENPQRGVALGIVSGSTGESAGFSWSYLMNYADSYKGVHWGLANYTREDFVGWQSGLGNYTSQNFKGLQTGAFNYAGSMKGLQWGLINYAGTVDSGVQLGLANIIADSPWFKDFPQSVAPAMVFLNWSF